MDENNIKSLIKEENIDNIHFTRIGEESNRIMLAVFDKETEETKNILAILVSQCIPRGQQVICIYLDKLGSKSDINTIVNILKKERVLKEVVKKKISLRFSKTNNYDYLKEKIFYLFTYDKAMIPAFETLSKEGIKRAYVLSPFFEKDELKKLSVNINTEVLYAGKDEMIDEKTIKFLAKNIPSHISKCPGEHKFTSKEQLIAFNEWLSGKRENGYADKIGLYIIGISIVISATILSLFGMGRIGVVVGLVLGIIVVGIRKRI